MRCLEAPIWGLQFHPEVAHTDDGLKILENFVCTICQCTGDWTTQAFIDQSVAAIRKQIGPGNVICGLSGGVDSSVAAALEMTVNRGRSRAPLARHCPMARTGHEMRDEAHQQGRTLGGGVHGIGRLWARRD